VARLPVVSGKELILALGKAGFETVHQDGSHVSLKAVIKHRMRRTVVPLHKELAKGTLSDILRQTGLTKQELIQLLGRK